MRLWHHSAAHPHQTILRKYPSAPSKPNPCPSQARWKPVWEQANMEGKAIISGACNWNSRHLQWLNFIFFQFTGSSSSRGLTLETNNGGKVWNVSAMTGWLATRYLSSPVSVKDVINFEHCVCQAVITQVNSVGRSHVIRVHMPCRSEVDDCTGLFCCQECGVTHLNEMLNKPGQQVRIDKKILLCGSISPSLATGITTRLLPCS